MFTFVGELSLFIAINVAVYCNKMNTFVHNLLLTVAIACKLGNCQNSITLNYIHRFEKPTRGWFIENSKIFVDYIFNKP